MKRWLPGFLVLVVMLLGTGCSALSQLERQQAQTIAVAARAQSVDCEREDRCAQPTPLRTLSEAVSDPAGPHAGRHFASLLDEGEAALAARLNLIRGARHAIDPQTYIFDTDDSARLVLDELLAAARRGVRVRLLIDQLSAITDLQTLAALSGAHANFQLRIYNPTFGKARLHYIDYAASVICCFRRFNQRMHNKLLVVDGEFGIVGGRNYQDDYYDWDSEYNFRDRDVLVTGSQVRVMARNFEDFWHAPRAVPVERLNDVGRLLLRQGVPALPPHQPRSPERIARVLQHATDPDWIQSRLVDTALPVERLHFVADRPGKHAADAAAVQPEDSIDLERLIGSAREEILLQTPYLVISDQAEALFRDLRRRDPVPQVTVSTNSLAATDNPIVYALSFKYKRRNLRDLGLDVYEYKPFPADPPVAAENRAVADPAAAAPAAATPVRNPRRHVDFGSRRLGTHNGLGDLRRRLPGGSEVEREVLRTETRPSYLGTRAVSRPLPVTGQGVRMGLHAKSMVIDRRIGVIGTHNFDPRSENYNTEGMVVIIDEAFAQALARSIERDISPDNAWLVAPRPRQGLLRQFHYNIARGAESVGLLDLSPWRYATVYEFVPSEACPFPVRRHDPSFRTCYRAVGDFPGVNVGGKLLLVRMLSAFGSGLVRIL